MPRYKLMPVSMLLVITTACAPFSSVVSVSAAFLGARAREAKIHARYPNSARGLKQQLKDMRQVARKGMSDQLRAMVTDLEIPDARAWYLANFGTYGSKLADYYERDLNRSEQRLQSQMIEFAHEDGYISVRKQNPKTIYPNSITSPDVFLAAWKSTSVDRENHYETPFGYFLFIDGKFRWDSTTMWVTVD